MIKCFFTVLCLSSIILFGCKQKPHGNDALPQITDFIVDSMYLPISESDRPNLRIKEMPYGVKGYGMIAFVKENNAKLYVYDLDLHLYTDSVSLLKYQKDYIDFAPKNADTFIIALKTNKIVALTKTYSKEWNVDFISKQFGDRTAIGYLSSEPLHIIGDTVMVTVFSNEPSPVRGKKPNPLFLKSYHDVAIKLLPDSSLLLYAHNPNKDYFYNQDYYTDIERIYINGNTILNSYAHSDTLILFNATNNKETKKRLSTSNFFRNNPFDYSQIEDYKYSLKYRAEQSRLGIGSLFYNKNKHEIYQIMKHKGVYIDSNGKKLGAEGAAQSLFVLDESLNQLKEVYMPPNSASSRYYYFIATNSLYIGAPKSKQKYHDKMLFYRIVFK